MASSPSPPVAFKNHCSIIHNGVLYVYSPDAFQTLELKEGAKWKQEQNGISATGAVCVKGGVDGDNDNPALYVVGGTTNSTTTNYTGIQRYSIQDKTWSAISPVSAVTSQRQYHGAAYLNASSSIIVYGGSQNGDSGPSTETFLMLMYPPYRVQSYSSVAPPVVNPTILPWDADQAVMVGGSTTNQNIFLFHPDNGWRDLGLALPNPLPDRSVAQSSLVTLDDNSKILLTFRTDKSPNEVSRNVLLNPFDQPATYGETAGSPTSSAVAAASSTASRMSKRATFLQSYPAYNGTAALNITRTNFALAQGSNDQTVLVGGDSSNSVVLYDKLANNWVAGLDVFGAQQPLTTSSSTTQVPSATAFPTRSATPSTTSSAAAGGGSNINGLAILGGVLGGICGLAAILIILLLWLRNVRRKKQKEAAKKNPPSYPEDKTSFEEQGLAPLSKQGQPMGRSPVPSTVIDERDSMALFGAKSTEKSIEAGGLKMHQPQNSGINFGQNPFKRQQSSPLTISKPMLADLGDYQARPSIELGKATPVAPVVATASPLMNSTTFLPDPTQKSDQRKTDEGWAKYFSAEREANPDASKRETTATETSVYSAPPPSRRGNGGGGFWPNSSATPTAPRSPKALRDSKGRTLTAHKVIAGSPNLQAGPTNPRTLTMSTAEGIPAHISSADSISTNATDDDDDEYEDEKMIAYSSGVPSVHDTAWTPVGNTWSGPPQRPLRPLSVTVGALDFPPATSMSNNTDDSGTTKSSIPAFPMPGSTIRKVPLKDELQPPRAINASDYRTSEDYFGRSPEPTSTTNKHPLAQASTQDNTDMSWLNLGTPKPQPQPQFVPRPQPTFQTQSQPQSETQPPSQIQHQSQSPSQ